jgi:hypothetical protein
MHSGDALNSANPVVSGGRRRTDWDRATRHLLLSDCFGRGCPTTGDAESGKPLPAKMPVKVGPNRYSKAMAKLLVGVPVARPTL